MKTIAIILASLFLITPAFSEDTTELGNNMDELSSQLKSLRRVDDGDWAEKVAVAQRAQEALLKCFPLIPALVEKTADAAEKGKQVAHYRQLLAENMVLLCKLELAFHAEDEDLSDDILRQLKEVKKKGHTEYIEDN